MVFLYRIAMQSGIYEVLSQGRAAAKAGEVQEARRYLELALMRAGSTAPEGLEALYWLSQISSDPDEQRSYLEDILAASPYDPRARRALAILDGKIEPTAMYNPDLPSAPGATERELDDADTHRFLCQRCGGRLTFTPAGDGLVCEWCETHAAPLAGGSRPAAAEELDFVLSMATAGAHQAPAAVQTGRCEGCGAGFFLPPSELTHTCPYCGANYVLDGEPNAGQVPPAAFLPFALDREAAGKTVWEAAQAAGLRRTSTRFTLQAVYLPAWLFTMGGEVAWNGLRGDNERSAQPVSGACPVDGWKYPISATRHMDGLFDGLLGGYRLDELRPYQPDALAGLAAETYQVPIAGASLEARAAALRDARQKIEHTQAEGVENLRVTSAGMAIAAVSLVLLPVWHATLPVSGQEVEILMNGQTGQHCWSTEIPRRGFLSWLLGED